jgi:hypothetical protein
MLKQHKKLAIGALGLVIAAGSYAINLVINRRGPWLLAFAAIALFGVAELFEPEARVDDLFQRLLDRGVLVRDFSTKPRLEGCVRVTIGTPAENDDFLAALDGALADAPTGTGTRTGQEHT